MVAALRYAVIQARVRIHVLAMRAMRRLEQPALLSTSVSQAMVAVDRTVRILVLARTHARVILGTLPRGKLAIQSINAPLVTADVLRTAYPQDRVPTHALVIPVIHRREARVQQSTSALQAMADALRIARIQVLVQIHARAIQDIPNLVTCAML